MITYDKVWERMKALGITGYALIKDGLAPPTLQRLRDGKPIDITTVNRLCKSLNCQPGDLLTYIPDPEESVTEDKKGM